MIDSLVPIVMQQTRLGRSHGSNVVDEGIKTAIAKEPSRISPFGRMCKCGR